MKKLRFSLSATLLLVWICLSCETTPTIESTTDDYIVWSDELSNQQITTFGEDAFGYIWIGTNRGANKYNGHQFLQYYHTLDTNSLSYNQIKAIFSDSKSRLWIATSFGVNQLSAQGAFSHIPIASGNQNVRHMAETDNGRLFLNTSDVICEFNEAEGAFFPSMTLPVGKMASNGFFIDKLNRLWTIGNNSVSYFDSDTFEEIASYPLSQTIFYAHLRSNGELWMAAGDKLVILDIKTGNFIPTPAVYRNHPVLSKSTISLIHSYDEVSLLINTQKDGLFLLNTYTGEISHQSESTFPFSVPNVEITTMFTDSNKNLWIGSYDQGFKVIYYYAQRFNPSGLLRTQTEGRSVVSMATDKEQNLWIVTRMDGLILWDKSDQQIRNIDLTGLLSQSLQFRERLNTISIDSRNRVWLHTNFRLIRCHYTNRQLLPETSYWIGAMNILSEDHDGTIWTAGSTRDLYYLKEGASDFQHIDIGLNQGINFTNGIITLSDGKLMIASFMQNPRIFDPATMEMEDVPLLQIAAQTVFVPTVLYEDGKGDVWIGSNSHGLFRYSLHTKKIEQMEGIACNEISSVMEDVQGNVWIGTLYGLFKYDRTINQFIGYYTSDGIGGSQFNERSVARMHDNSLVFGGTHGITMFNPIDVSIRRSIPLFVEELRVNNRRVEPKNNSIIDSAMTFTPDVWLAYNENSIQLSYAALDYSEYSHIQYAYRLVGFEDRWTEIRNLHQASYSNLPAGDFTFEVRIRSHDNTVTEAITAVPIHVARAPWFSTPALCLYVLIIGSLIMLILHLYNRILFNRKQAVLALQEKEHEKYLNRMNMSFFANISHEFRTPLTLISGPVSTLCQDETIQGENKRLLFVLQRNVRRMLRLVNQILDFNRLENDTLKLNVQQIEVISSLRDITEMFRPNCEEREITLTQYGFEDSFQAWIDTDKLEKIIVNLLSNAIKYTQKSGHIDVRFDVVSDKSAKSLCPHLADNPSSDYIKIKVEDTGIGIPPEEIENIFKRYYQLDSKSKGQVNWGTGIGLYFSRRLACLHHGYIFAENKKETTGSIFTLLLPTNQALYSPEEIDNEPIADNLFLIPNSEASVMRSVHTDIIESETTKPVILVVDDETEIVCYLKDLLSPFFEVICRYDAEAAWKAVEELSPDLVISDVIMPGTDGYTLCTRIKENLPTCHIPVILLTAKVSVSDQVDGLNVGANAYVTKPFEPSYLVALVKSQLRNRDNARRLLSGTTQADAISKDILSLQDKAFMDSLYSIMENEISNPELNITRMTEVLHISRTKFYYKVKGLTGENPNVFFKTYKLNRAAELIKKGTHSMSEIADMTGFSTPSHFSVSFKKQFGVAPSEYK
ncbi:response regulator [Parabacteroides sp. OttesenSCG-928-G07]|nr:response regulator [Parabacteroides sp. OttesenSCG-928-G07]